VTTLQQGDICVLCELSDTDCSLLNSTRLSHWVIFTAASVCNDAIDAATRYNHCISTVVDRQVASSSSPPLLFTWVGSCSSAFDPTSLWFSTCLRSYGVVNVVNVYTVVLKSTILFLKYLNQREPISIVLAVRHNRLTSMMMWCNAVYLVQASKRGTQRCKPRLSTTSHSRDICRGRRFLRKFGRNLPVL